MAETDEWSKQTPFEDTGSLRSDGRAVVPRIFFHDKGDYRKIEPVLDRKEA